VKLTFFLSYPHLLYQTNYKGARLEQKEIIAVKSGVKPVHFEFKGNYGVAVHWSDGYTHDIFPYDVLKDIAEEVKGN